MSSMEQLDANGRPTTLYVADAAGDDAPGVVLYHAWWGLNDDVKAFADRLADSGFYRGRARPLPRLDHGRDRGGEAAHPVGGRGRRRRDRAGGHRPPRDRPNAPSRIGAVGFSFGAHWAMWSAAQRDAVGASVVYYGTTGGPFLAEARIPVQGHFAADDPFEGPDDVAAFEGALRDAGREVAIHTYPATGHWFAEPSRDAYRREAAEQALERTVAFLQEQLRPA